MPMKIAFTIFSGIGIIVGRMRPTPVNLFTSNVSCRIDGIYQPYQPLKKFILCRHTCFSLKVFSANKDNKGTQINLIPKNIVSIFWENSFLKKIWLNKKKGVSLQPKNKVIEFQLKNSWDFLLSKI